MRRRRGLGLVLLLGATGGFALLRRRARHARERADLYFEDGSMVSLDERSPEAMRLLPLGRDLLHAVRD